jgi:hypothetical protein
MEGAVDRVSKSTKGKRLDWDEWYALAREYYEANGDLIVPANYMTPEGHKLGKWISRQRAKYNNSPHVKGTISDTEIKLLEKIGMTWRLEYRFRWDEWIEQLAIYKEEKGDLLIPRDYRQGIYHLGNWIVEKRRLYWRGELTDTQIQELENLGMEWALSFQRDWDEWYEDAKAYYEKHGDLMIPTDYVTDEGYRLGQWISEQRGKFSHRKGKPTIKAAEVQKLNQIGMVWVIKLQLKKKKQEKGKKKVS